eukprot:TRINITY_DN2140_c1_g3_i1.p1 TRINITY_DN2140_c1_g3~~TRINITY_DN2140_c1_g3_i1.p1  ORF type:complete len:243 (+),score=75.52 TRINITY_DN2140_c1_g3_i1:87-731(+)
MATAIGNLLTETTAVNDRNPEGEPTAFDGKHAAPIPILDYTLRLANFGRMSEEALACAAVLLDRLAARCPHLAPSSRNAHRLLLAAVLVASKVRDDVHFGNAYFARLGGLPRRELAGLETYFLVSLDFHADVGLSEYAWYLHAIDMRHGPLAGRSAALVAELRSRLSAQQSLSVVPVPPPLPRGSGSCIREEIVAAGGGDVAMALDSPLRGQTA